METNKTADLVLKDLTNTEINLLAIVAKQQMDEATKISNETLFLLMEKLLESTIEPYSKTNPIFNIADLISNNS